MLGSTIPALAALAALTACATIRVGADFAPGANFQSYTTYDWDVRDAMPTGDPRLDQNPFFEARLREAVDHQLAVRGLRRVSTSPDLLVHYHASVRDRIDVRRADEPRGYVVGESDTYVYEEGTILVDIAEASGKRVVWRGWAQAELSELLATPKTMAVRLSEIAQRMFEHFPRSLVPAKPVAVPPA
jgi:hypothetical protein